MADLSRFFGNTLRQALGIPADQPVTWNELLARVRNLHDVQTQLSKDADDARQHGLSADSSSTYALGLLKQFGFEPTLEDG